MALLPNRRWLRYSIRTLLVAVTLFCIWLGWQVSIVRERKALRTWLGDGRAWQTAEVLPPYDAPSQYVPAFHRRLLGDFTLIVASVKPEVTMEELERLKRAFPEAQILQRSSPAGLVY